MKQEEGTNNQEGVEILLEHISDEIEKSKRILEYTSKNIKRMEKLLNLAREQVK